VQGKELGVVIQVNKRVFSVLREAWLVICIDELVDHWHFDDYVLECRVNHTRCLAVGLACASLQLDFKVVEFIPVELASDWVVVVRVKAVESLAIPFFPREEIKAFGGLLRAVSEADRSALSLSILFFDSLNGEACDWFVEFDSLLRESVHGAESEDKLWLECLAFAITV
jgi:hypothetical protein